MILRIKTFQELTTKELYEILRLRSKVFIVEQGGRYQDLDKIDYESIHIFYVDEKEEVAGCIRIFPKKDEKGTIQLGRLVVDKRNQGMGRNLMECAKKTAQERYGAEQLYLTGRKSALGFYLKCVYHEASPELFAGETSYYELRSSI